MRKKRTVSHVQINENRSFQGRLLREFNRNVNTLEFTSAIARTRDKMVGLHVRSYNDWHNCAYPFDES